MKNEQVESGGSKKIWYAFEGGMALKGLHAIVEIMGGILVLFVSQDFFARVVLAITSDEISEDPRDMVATYLINLSQHFSIRAEHFIAFYLLSHGLVKGFLVLQLLRKKLWAYPLSLLVFGAFTVYQMTRYFFTHSIWLVVFSVFDVVVIWLIWYEYRAQKQGKDNNGYDQ